MNHELLRNEATLLDPAAFDWLQKIGGNKLIQGIIVLFLKHCPQQVASAVQAQEQGDMDSLKRAAHSLKSSAANLGARGLHQLAATIERRAASQEAAPVGVLVAALPGMFDQVKEHLEKVAGGLQL